VARENTSPALFGLSPRWARWTLLISSTLLTLLTVETGLRFAAHLEHTRHRRALAGLGTVELAPEPGSTKLGHLIRRSEHPRLIYELKPGLDVTYIGKRVMTNSRGLRSPEIPLDKPSGTIRILGLGDSLMFGWGVSESECYLRLIESKLNARYPEVDWQVINGGIPGYNTAMEVEFLLRRGLELEPDAVVIEFVGNDLDLPNFIWLRTDYLSPRRLLLLELLGEQGHHSERDAPTELIAAPLALNGRHYARGLLETPSRYRSMVGVGAYRAALVELAHLGREHDFATLVVSLHRVPTFVRRAAAANRFPIAEAAEGIRAYLDENGHRQYYPSPLTIGPRDPHPSAIAHRIQADAYLEGLERSGILRQLVASASRTRGSRAQGDGT
jgi:hypothetical protein